MYRQVWLIIESGQPVEDTYGYVNVCVCVVFYLSGKSCQSSLVGRDTGSPGQSQGMWPHGRMDGSHNAVQLHQPVNKKIKLANQTSISKHHMQKAGL